MGIKNIRRKIRKMNPQVTKIAEPTLRKTIIVQDNDNNINPIPLIEPTPDIKRIIVDDAYKQNIKSTKNKIIDDFYRFIYLDDTLKPDEIQILNRRLDKELLNLNVYQAFIDLFYFKSFIKDKTIAMVANSSDLLTREVGELIDAHDIVIRYNSYKIIRQHTGEKTTIHASVYLQNENLTEYVPIRVIISINSGKWAAKVKTLNKLDQGLILKYNHHRSLPKPLKDDKPPTTGFSILILLLKLGGYKQIDLFGFDFYKNGPDSILRSKAGMEFPVSNVHNYTLEKDIIMEYCYEFDEKSNIITFYDHSSR